MNIEQMMVTPDVATRLLSYNTNNRAIKRHAVNEYAYKMAHGLWDENVLDPIVVTKDGVLENGQHRLLAVIKSGVPVQMLVATKTESASGAYDVGVPRSSLDSLKIRGNLPAELGNTAVQGVISYFFEKLDLPRKTPELIEKYCEKYGRFLRDAYTASRAGNSRSPICRKCGAISGAYAALRCGVDPEEIEKFFRVTNTGFSNRPQDSTAVLLRNYILTMDKVTATTVAPYPARKTLHIFTEYAIADYVAGKSRMKAYRLDADKMPYFPRVLQEDVEYMKGVKE